MPDPSSDDAERLRRLSEEVRSRLFEIALILSRTAGVALPKNVKFMTSEAVLAKNAGSSGNWMEIIDVDGKEACYGVIDGVPFAESPCGH
jgi:hypothetical protein